MKQLFLLLSSFLILSACGSKLHPLEEPAKFSLPQVVKPVDLIQETDVIDDSTHENTLAIDIE